MTALALQSFIYEAEPVRVVMINDKPWMVAADVAALLGFARARDMVRMLSDHQKGAHKVRTLGGEQNLTIISEGGLFKCILRSKRPEAERFGDWVTDELLPTLRLTGRYEIGNDEIVVPAPDLPDEIEALRTKLAIAREARVVFGLKHARRAWRLIGLLPELTEDVEEPSFGHAIPNALARLHRSVTEWLEARTEPCPGRRVASGELYNDYLDWAKAQDVPPAERVNMTAFGRTLSNCGVGSVKSDRVYRVGLKLAA